MAGPKRPQDRVPLSNAKSMFRTALRDYASTGNGHSEITDGGIDEADAESFPASDPSRPFESKPSDQPISVNVDPVGDRPSNPVQTVLEDGTKVELDHGAVTIAAITSCTNTSNPYVMRFGLDDGRPRTLDEVGRHLGLTRERIRQIERDTLAELRTEGRADGLKEYVA